MRVDNNGAEWDWWQASGVVVVIASDCCLHAFALAICDSIPHPHTIPPPLSPHPHANQLNSTHPTPISLPPPACTRSRHIAVRRLATRALASLVTVADALDLITTLTSRLTSGALPWNEAHGALLVLGGLMEGVAGGATPSVAVALCGRGFEGLKPALHLARGGSAPGPVAEAVLEASLRVGGWGWGNDE